MRLINDFLWRGRNPYASNRELAPRPLPHERLTFLHQGRRFRLTEVAGRVVEPIIA